MGRIYERIDDHLHKWINKQSMFFVGTAPAAADGPRVKPIARSLTHPAAAAVAFDDLARLAHANTRAQLMVN